MPYRDLSAVSGCRISNWFIICRCCVAVCRHTYAPRVGDCLARYVYRGLRPAPYAHPSDVELRAHRSISFLCWQLFFIRRIRAGSARRVCSGFGDVILAVSIGMLLGAMDGLFAVWLACVLGSLYGIYQILSHKVRRAGHAHTQSIIGHQIPFGPFLTAGFALVFLNYITSASLFDALALSVL
jgi:hypothetical protein